MIKLNNLFIIHSVAYSKFETLNLHFIIWRHLHYGLKNI